MRSLTAAADAALAGQGLCCCLMVELYFDSDTTYMTSLNRNLVYGGNTYLGVGTMGSIDPVEEGTEVQPRGINISLSAIQPDKVALFQNEQYQGRRCIIRLALLDANHQVVADPILIFRGRIDQPKINLGGTATITLSVENRLADWDRPRQRRFNDADQQARFPGDTFFQFVAQMVAKPLNWGVAGAPNQDAANLMAAVAAVQKIF